MGWRLQEPGQSLKTSFGLLDFALCALLALSHIFSRLTSSANPVRIRPPPPALVLHLFPRQECYHSLTIGISRPFGKNRELLWAKSVDKPNLHLSLVVPHPHQNEKGTNEMDVVAVLSVWESVTRQKFADLDQKTSHCVATELVLHEDETRARYPRMNLSKPRL